MRFSCEVGRYRKPFHESRVGYGVDHSGRNAATDPCLIMTEQTRTLISASLSSWLVMLLSARLCMLISPWQVRLTRCLYAMVLAQQPMVETSRKSIVSTSIAFRLAFGLPRGSNCEGSAGRWMLRYQYLSILAEGVGCFT